LVAAARDGAIDLANDSRSYGRAEAILRQLLTLPLYADWRKRIESDLQKIKEIRQDLGLAPGDAQVLPIGTPPSLSTYYGFGTMLYGRTLFVTMLFLPILAIGHYLVRREGDSYLYLGRLPLSSWHKIWNSVVVLALLGALGYQTWFRGQSDPTASLPSEPSYIVPAKSPGPAPRKQAIREPNRPGSRLQSAPAKPKRNETKLAREDEPSVSFSTDTNARVVPDDTIREAGLERLQGLIRAEKTRMDSLKQQLDADDKTVAREEAELAALSTSLKSAKAEVDRYAADREAGLPTDEVAYQQALDNYNSMVDRYNGGVSPIRTLIKERNQRLAVYKEALREHNRLVDDYNALLAEGR
jgi:hypothetical protein